MKCQPCPEDRRLYVRRHLPATETDPDWLPLPRHVSYRRVDVIRGRKPGRAVCLSAEVSAPKRASITRTQFPLCTWGECATPPHAQTEGVSSRCASRRRRRSTTRL